METTRNENWTALVEGLAERWWVLVVRGLAAVLFGVLTLVSPGTSLLALVTLWGVYALIDGGSNIALTVSAGRAGARWGWFLFEGIVSIGAGVATFFWPGITGLVLLSVIAAWAIITGIAELAAAIRLRKVIRHEWSLGLAGVLSVVFGVLLLARPGAGALAVAWLIGVYAIAFGGLLIGLGARIHRWLQPNARTRPVPVPAGAK